MQEKEINLVDLIVEVVLHWRMFIVWMLVGAVLLGAFGYVRSYRTANEQAKQVEEAQQLLDEMRSEYDTELTEDYEDEIAKLLRWSKEQLTDVQILNVEYTLAYEKLFEQRLTYQEESVLMQMDPDQIYKGSVTFHVSSEDREKSFSIEEIYEGIIRSAGMSQYVAEKMGIAVFGVTELISIQSVSTSKLEGKDSFTVEVLYSDEQGCHDMIQAVTEFVDSKKAELEELFGDYVITALQPSYAVLSSSSVLNTQRNYLNDLMSLQNTIVSRKDNFSIEEWQYYDILLNGKITELSSEKVDEAVEAATAEKEAIELAQAESEADLLAIIERGVTVSPRISMRYIVLGAILAAFVYAFLLFVVYILNTKLRSTDNLQEIYGIPQFGLIPAQKEQKKPFGFVDEWILSIRNRNKRNFTKEEASNLINVAVKMSVEREVLNMIYLVGCDLKGRTMEVCQQLKESLQPDNIQVDILSNVLYDAQAMGKLENAKGAVLVETAQSTLYDEIYQELDLLKRQEIKVLGGIIVE